MKYFTIKVWLYPLCKILIKGVKGIENIPNKTAFIIVSNHQRVKEYWIIFYLILKKLNKKVHFIAVPKYWFLGDTIFRQWAGCIPLFNPKQAYNESKELLKSDEIVGIFPEGVIANKKRINLKTGAIRLALEANAPILPMGIKFSYKPFSSTINIGKLTYPKKYKSTKKQILDLMKYVYRLRDSKV